MRHEDRGAQPGGEPGERARIDTTGHIPFGALLAAGLTLGLAADALLRAPGPPALNLALWLASVAVAALVLARRSGRSADRTRVAALAVAVMSAAGLAWRDAPALKILALGCTTTALALAAYRAVGAWMYVAGVVEYGSAWVTGALHAWIAATLVLIDAGRSRPTARKGRTGWARTMAVARGAAIAMPLVAIFGALLMAADAVFADLILGLVQINLDRLMSHLLLVALSGWLATGYLRGFLTGTELRPLQALWRDREPRGLGLLRPRLGILEVATPLAALDALFLAFVVVQFRDLFGGAALVQVTPHLTSADYARRGFFELVVAALLVVPVLLAADWLLDRRSRSDDLVFRSLAGVQIGLVLTIAVSALERLRLYQASYGLTEPRVYAGAFLIWIGAALVWLAATVLRGRRDAFAFGALVAGFATVALLFVANPDALVTRTNVARVGSADAWPRFDATYAASLGADAVPPLVAALPGLPLDVRCPLARELLRRWAPEGPGVGLNWNWAESRARAVVRGDESWLRSMVGPTGVCRQAEGQ